MNKKLPYKEGDWFAVPLPSSGFAVGRIARMKKGSPGLLGYFFGPRLTTIPKLEDVEYLNPKDAIAVYRFGYLNLRDGKWPVLGSNTNKIWEREKWPMPAFKMKDALIPDRYWRIIYSDDEPIKEIHREVVPFEMIKNLPIDGGHGADSVAINLDKLLTT